MILSCQNIKKSFGTVSILEEVSFHIEEREKAALVGPNGAGKSTLLKIITGELAPDEGLVVLSKGTQLGYLAQHQELDTGATIYEEVRKVKQYLLEWEERIRSMEEEMRGLTGSSLESLMESYTRLTHAYEQENGYAYESELTGV